MLPLYPRLPVYAANFDTDAVIKPLFPHRREGVNLIEPVTAEAYSVATFGMLAKTYLTCLYYKYFKSQPFKTTLLQTKVR